MKQLLVVLCLLVVLVALAGVNVVIAAQDEDVININTATEEELRQLTGIGEVKAKRIIEHRKAHGPFKSIEDIMNVKGIGEKTFMKFKDRIVVGGETNVGKKTSRPVTPRGRKVTTWGRLKSAR